MVTRLMLAIFGIVLLVMPVAAGTIAENVAKLNVPPETLLKLGEEIYNTEGANTCLKCHGKGGTGGDQAGAADLRHPRTWVSYQALGGDAAFEANKDEFLKNLEIALHYLINKGGTTWNQRFSKAHKDVTYNWYGVKNADGKDVDKYDSMMKGVTTGPMKKQVKALKGKLGDAGKKLKSKQLAEVAAVAAYEYVKSFDDGSDKGGVFK
ncbi:hypothetical protein C2W62_22665 [Candidatus Entotheonella serta]|nr:hypothetical protein C2W62_22665 [Candidatus Entotheonella serta]